MTTIESSAGRCCWLLQVTICFGHFWFDFRWGHVAERALSWTFCNDNIGELYRTTNFLKLGNWCSEALNGSLVSLVYFACVVYQWFSTLFGLVCFSLVPPLEKILPTPMVVIQMYVHQTLCCFYTTKKIPHGTTHSIRTILKYFSSGAVDYTSLPLTPSVERNPFPAKNQTLKILQSKYFAYEIG